jgi:hypothetical protein
LGLYDSKETSLRDADCTLDCFEDQQLTKLRGWYCPANGGAAPGHAQPVHRRLLDDRGLQSKEVRRALESFAQTTAPYIAMRGAIRRALEKDAALPR